MQGSVGKEHIHLLVAFPPSKLVQYLKGRSSRLLQEQFPELRKRYWGQHLCAIPPTLVGWLFKRFLGSNVYMTNAFMGEVFALLLGIIALFVGVDKLLILVTREAPITTEMLLPAIPLIVYFFIGMVPTTVCSPSLEGKNFWIVKSMPIEPKILYLGKILFNLYLTIPFATFATLLQRQGFLIRSYI